MSRMRILASDALVETIATEILNDFIASLELSNPQEVNEGYCVEFADELASALGAHEINAEVNHRDWIEVALRGLTEDEADELDADDGYILPHHVWVEANGKCYDAEALQGVSSWVELPIYQRFFSKNHLISSSTSQT